MSTKVITGGRVVDLVVHTAPELPQTWQRLWMHARHASWRTLAIVPAEGDTSSVEVAQALEPVAARCEKREVQFIDATHLTLTEASALSDFITDSTFLARTAVFGLSCPLEDAAALSVAKSVDAVLLLVFLGKTELDRAKKLIEILGRDKIVGCVALRARTPDEGERS